MGVNTAVQKKKEKKKQGQREKKEVSRLSETPFMATFFFFTCTGSITPVQKVSRNIRSKAHGFALRNFSFFSFKKSFKNKKKGIIETMNNEQ